MSSEPLPGALASEGLLQPAWAVMDLDETEVPIEWAVVAGPGADAGPATEARQAAEARPAAEAFRAAGARGRVLLAHLQMAPPAVTDAPQPTGAEYYRLLQTPDDELSRQERDDVNRILLTRILRQMAGQ